MKFKRLMSASLAGIMAVSSSIVCQIGASAAALENKPEGTEKVIATVDLSKATTSFTKTWENGTWVQTPDLGAGILTKENVYVKLVVTDLGNVETNDGATPWSTMLTWPFESYNWASVIKWYNNSKDDSGNPLPENFEVAFTPTVGSTVEEAICYAPISDFSLVSWGNVIAGNIQAGHTAGVTIKSLEVVEFTAAPVAEKYAITATADPAEGGTVEVDKEEAEEGEDVTVTTSPAHGYNLFDIITDDDTVTVTKNGNTGTFKMPGKAVKVTAKFEEDNALLVAAAKEAADKAIAAISATNSTDGDAILTKVTEAVDAAVSKIIADAKVTAKWKAAPTITKATEEAAGSIVGTIVLSKGEGDKQATAESKVELTIPKLAADDKTRIEQAVKLTEGVLEELKGKVTNETTETDILDKIKEAIVDTKAEATISNFKSEKATSEKAGKITGTVNLKSGNETGTVKIALDIAILEKTDAEKLADAKKAAQEVVDAAKTAEDITKEAIEKAVNNKDVDVKVEYKITKEATTEAEGEATVTVTLTLGKESETITETFVIAKLKHSAPSEEKVEKKDPTAIWEGSQALGNWDQQIDLAGEKIADLGAGVLIFELADCTEEAKLCVQLKDGSWPCLDGTEILTLKNGQTEARIAVTAEALAATKKCGAAVKGSGVTVKKISFIGTEDNFDKKVTVSANDDKAPSVSTVVTEIDDEGKMEQIAICAISEEAAKTCTSYKVTITRASDNKVFTVEKVTDCWKKAKYTNVNGEEVLVEAAEGDYCIVLDITGISGEWGALTIRITANNE